MKRETVPRTGAGAIVRQAEQELREYFAGRRRTFTVKLDLEGTEFQRKAWQAMRKIPFGETISYGDQARKVGKPKAYRAVGSANGKNPIPIIVPCHRVLASDGSLGGYSLGLSMKRRLLALEGVSVAELIRSTHAGDRRVTLRQVGRTRRHVVRATSPTSHVRRR